MTPTHFLRCACRDTPVADIRPGQDMCMRCGMPLRLVVITQPPKETQ